MIAHSIADRTSTTAVSSDDRPDGDFLITDSASSPSQSTDLAEALEKASAGLTDVLALLGNDRSHRTLRHKVADWLLEKPLHDLAQADELFLSLGVKDLT